MRIRYRFPVRGRLRLNGSFPLVHLGREFMLELDADQVVTHLRVTAPIGSSDVSVVQSADEPAGAMHLELTSPGLDELRPLVRTIEGLLAMFGVEAVDMQEAEQTWLPDTSEEERALQVRSAILGRHRPRPTDHPVIEFAYAAQAILGVEKVLSHEVALNFFRRGKADLADERFIDAYYDFFFILESLFAEGHSKTAKVKAEFRKCAALQEAVAATMNSENLSHLIGRRSYLRSAFEERYSGRSSAEITDSFVDLRGFLHHHSSKRPDAWHPADQQSYHFDAEFIANVCASLMQERVFPALYSPEGAALFKAAVESRPAEERSPLTRADEVQ